MEKYNYLDLFSGIGGFRLGAEWAGLKFKKEFHSDIDDYANKVYNKNFPDSIQLGDITKIDTEELLKYGDNWIVTGGFPCQNISIAGKGEGIYGDRSSLWFEMWRIISGIRPKFAIMENVAALTFRGLIQVLGSLAEIGFDAEWQDIRAEDMGAPHKRERLWIIAYPNSNIESGGSINERSIQRELVSNTNGINGGRGDLDEFRDKRRGESSTEQEIIQPKDRKTSTSDSEQVCEDVAYPQSERINRIMGDYKKKKGRNDEFNSSSENELPIASSKRLEGEKSERKDRREQGLFIKCGQWEAEPNVGRVVNGIPNRSHRLRCLGNSIVPQIAELLFKQIKDLL